MLIEGGWVQVNDRVVEEPGYRVSDQVVVIDANAQPEPIIPVTLLWHRPPDAGPCDPEALRHIPVPGLRLLRKNLLHQQVVAPLHAPFTGLVVFTQDGRVRRRLFEDAALIEHEYMVELPGQLTDQGIDNLRNHLQQARAWPQVPVRSQARTALTSKYTAVFIASGELHTWFDLSMALGSAGKGTGLPGNGLSRARDGWVTSSSLGFRP